MQILQKKHEAQSNHQNPLRKLSKLELLELLARQEGELQSLRRELAEKEEALRDRTLQMETAGSIAEAAIRVNDVFGAAQRAADQYLESLRGRTEQLNLQDSSAGTGKGAAP